jgi:hypothetical protein
MWPQRGEAGRRLHAQALDAIDARALGSGRNDGQRARVMLF